MSNGSLKSPVPSTANGKSPMSFPDVPLPKAPDPALDPAGYLRSIYAVRERSRLVLEKAKKNQLKHFTVDMSKFQDTAAYVVSIIKVRAPKSATCLLFWYVEYTADFSGSEIMRPTTPLYLRTADGNTSMSAGGRESTSLWHRGHRLSTTKSGRAV